MKRLLQGALLGSLLIGALATVGCGQKVEDQPIPKSTDAIKPGAQKQGSTTRPPMPGP